MASGSLPLMRKVSLLLPRLWRAALTLLEDVLTLFAALLLLLYRRIIGGTFNRFVRGLRARLHGLFPEQTVVRAGRFNDRAVTGQTRAVRTTRFQYRARERFKKTLGQRVLVQYDEATNIGMIRRNPSCHPHASQIQPRQSLQFTQSVNALHHAIQDQPHHQAWRVRSTPGGSIALLERQPILLSGQVRHDEGCTLAGLLQIVLQARRPQHDLVRIARYKSPSRIRRVWPWSRILNPYFTKQIVLLAVW